MYVARTIALKSAAKILLFFEICNTLYIFIQKKSPEGLSLFA